MSYQQPPYPPIFNAPPPPPPYYPIGSATQPLPPGNDNSVSRTVAWGVIVVSVALLAILNWSESRQAGHASATTANPPAMQFEFIGRYMVGVHAMFSHSGQNDPSVELSVKEFDQASKTPTDKLAAVVIVGELLGDKPALQRLKVMMAPPASHTRDANPAPDPLAGALKLIYTDGPQHLSAKQRKLLVEHLGWYGKLAETFGKPDSDPQRAAILAGARQTALASIVLLIVICIGLLLGLVLLIIFLLRLKDRKVRLNYQPVPGSDRFLEAFAIYLGGMTASFFAAPYLPGSLHKSISAHLALMLLPTILAIAWPALRGTGSGAWRYGLGWHAGRGFFREIAMGLLGYVAGLPVLALGALITLKLIGVSGATPSHPIDHMIGGGAKLTFLAFLLASVYAPLTEETMFRGAFFHALRGRHRWLFSAVVSSFIFAAIHPQGWTVVPTLMAIAVVFAGIREWRGTILSSAAAHCVHNTLTLLLVLLMMRG